MDDDQRVVVVQDFSNLKPPRVAMKMDDFLKTNVKCAFQSTTKPFVLVEFCLLIECFKKGDTPFEEVSELLRREGY